MIDQDCFNRIVRRIEAYEQEMIRLQIGLCAIPALAPENGGDGEYRKAAFLKSYLREAGFPHVEEINAADDRVSSGVRPNLIVRIPGKNTEKTAWVLTHVDVVPPGELSLWREDPYRGYVSEGKLFGRGMEDNQQDLVASLFAARAILEEGIVPENTLGLSFVADEETSSRKGLGYLLAQEANPFRQTDLIVVPDAGNQEGDFIEISEKSMLWLRFKTTGRQCHGSRPSLGKNAFLAGSHLVVKLQGLHEVFALLDPLFDPPESTFQPTRKDANIPNINTIPGEDVFYSDYRVLPCYPLDKVLETVRRLADEIEERFGVAVEVSPVERVQAPPPTPPDSPVVVALRDAVQAIYGIRPRLAGIGGGTVAACFRKAGYPAAVWSRLRETAHQPNEYCLIADMVGNAKVYAHLFLQGDSPSAEETIDRK
ncbi:MAG: M20 family metallo-hydrolase [Proteobacteria bacterium]|nr:M20 family metallo-hydrolase [Pseudomonadota bacterium]MBU2228046.1 M20 family metallo-hydrolase [Pseudomonadota bacterium]MBU2261859.1 M20 family metallo-hydrolase [Pseudomonadota bacterium]